MRNRLRSAASGWTSSCPRPSASRSRATAHAARMVRKGRRGRGHRRCRRRRSFIGSTSWPRTSRTIRTTPRASWSSAEQNPEPTGKDMTSLVVSRTQASRRRAVPAAGAVRQSSTQPDRIESRPSRRAVWDYNFFIDLRRPPVGRQDQAGAGAGAFAGRDVQGARLLSARRWSERFCSRQERAAGRAVAGGLLRPACRSKSCSGAWASSDAIKLASNENPLGMSPKAQAAVAGALNSADWRAIRTAAAIASRQSSRQLHGIDAERITLGNGSNDILEFARARVSGTGARGDVLAPRIRGVSDRRPGAGRRELSWCRHVPATDAMPYGHDLEAFVAALRRMTSR